MDYPHSIDIKEETYGRETYQRQKKKMEVGRKERALFIYSTRLKY